MEELLENFNRLRNEEKWVEAAEVEMELCDEYFNVVLTSVIWRFQYTKEERKELEKRAEEDRKVAYWVGRLKTRGFGGYEKDLEEAYMWISRAAAAGHVKANYLKGHLLLCGGGVKQDIDAALKCYEEVCAAGLKFACYSAANVHKEAMRFFQAALWHKRGVALGNFYCVHEFEQLKQQRPKDICPWGEWRPDQEYHCFVPPEVQEAVKTTLLLFKRIGVTRYLAWKVCAYVVTRSGWKLN